MKRVARNCGQAARCGKGGQRRGFFRGFFGSKEENRQPHQVLGVKSDATLDELNATFKVLVRTKHPDQSGGSSEEFQEINQAYEKMKKSLMQKGGDGAKTKRQAMFSLDVPVWLGAERECGAIDSLLLWAKMQKEARAGKEPVGSLNSFFDPAPLEASPFPDNWQFQAVHVDGDTPVQRMRMAQAIEQRLKAAIPLVRKANDPWLARAMGRLCGVQPERKVFIWGTLRVSSTLPPSGEKDGFLATLDPFATPEEVAQVLIQAERLSTDRLYEYSNHIRDATSTLSSHGWVPYLDYDPVPDVPVFNSDVAGLLGGKKEPKEVDKDQKDPNAPGNPDGKQDEPKAQKEEEKFEDDQEKRADDEKRENKGEDGERKDEKGEDGDGEQRDDKKKDNKKESAYEAFQRMQAEAARSLQKGDKAVSKLTKVMGAMPFVFPTLKPVPGYDAIPTPIMQEALHDHLLEQKDMYIELYKEYQQHIRKEEADGPITEFGFRTQMLKEPPTCPFDTSSFWGLNTDARAAIANETLSGRLLFREDWKFVEEELLEPETFMKVAEMCAQESRKYHSVHHFVQQSAPFVALKYEPGSSFYTPSRWHFFLENLRNSPLFEEINDAGLVVQMGKKFSRRPGGGLILPWTFGSNRDENHAETVFTLPAEDESVIKLE